MAETPKLGHFDLLEELAHGGMGTVYRAFDPTLNREVAIKVLREQFAKDPKFLEEFLREARTAAAISHPHIVQVHFVGDHEGRYYIVMELLKGRTLRAIKEQDGPLTEERALEMAMQVAEGLRAAYTTQMIHGDIKPANIFITDDIGAKILDFGLAKLADVEVSGTGEIWGSPYYLSPERVGRKAEDFRSDIYSLGATLFDALAGRPPFDAEKPEDLAVKRLSEKPPLLRSINPKITAKTEEVVNKMLNKSPLLRYRDYEHLLEELGEAKTASTAKRLGITLLPGAGGLVAPPAVEAAPPPPAKSRLPLFIGLAVGAVAVILLILLVAMPRSATDTASRTTNHPPAALAVTTAPPPTTTGQTPPPAPPRPATDLEVQRKIGEDKAAIEEVLLAVNPFWATYDFQTALAQLEEVNRRLATGPGRKALLPSLAAARFLVEFKKQMTADFVRQPYDRHDVVTRAGVALPGRIAGATDDNLVAAMQYGETTVAWRDLAPVALVQMAEFYGGVFAMMDSPAIVARRHLKLAVFCHQYGLEQKAAFHATEAIKLDTALRQDVVDVFGTVPIYKPPVAPKPAPTPKTPKTPKLKGLNR